MISNIMQIPKIKTYRNSNQNMKITRIITKTIKMKIIIIWKMKIYIIIISKQKIMITWDKAMKMLTIDIMGKIMSIKMSSQIKFSMIIIIIIKITSNNKTSLTWTTWVLYRNRLVMKINRNNNI